jgi:hypothetical protein
MFIAIRFCNNLLRSVGAKCQADNSTLFLEEDRNGKYLLPNLHSNRFRS